MTIIWILICGPGMTAGKLRRWQRETSDNAFRSGGRTLRAAVTFLKEKLLIQWIEPTYCSFNQTRYQYRPETWVEDLYTGQANEEHWHS